MQGGGRCKYVPGTFPGPSCPSGAPGSPGTTFGVRPGGMIHTKYVPDPVRDRAYGYNATGYLRPGYDTGRGG